MVQETHIEFFATRGDLEAGFRSFESARAVNYFRMGMFDSMEVESFDSIFDYPTFGISGADKFGDRFLIIDRDKKLDVRPVKQQQGGCQYVVDLTFNRLSIFFRPGGLYQQRGIINGEAYIIRKDYFADESEQQYAQQFFTEFKVRVLRDFIKLKHYYCGAEALKINQQGVRLITMDINQSELYDFDVKEAQTKRFSTNELKTRQNYQESCVILQTLGFLAAGDIPKQPARMPRFDDEAPLGISFFRTGIEDEELENLTLSRTFFSRSSISRISFKNCDLSESSMNWNDLIEVDFTRADLSYCDLRSSEFTEVNFSGANLSYADLRYSEFTDCNFKNARMKGTKLTDIQGDELKLSKKQRAEIDWQIDNGEIPGGG